MTDDELLKEGEKEKLIEFDKKREFITYFYHNKKRKFTNPEEKVQAISFLKLILEYNYPKEHIKLFESVKMGSSTKEADIIVYAEASCETPYIIVECKKREITDREFSQAIEQAFSYATTELAKFVWVTSGYKDEYFKVLHERPRKRETIPNIPIFGSNEIVEYKFVAGGEDKEGRKYFDLQKIEQDELTEIFKKAHDTLWGGGELNPSSAFDELDKLIFCKIWDEKHTGIGEPYRFQIIKKHTNAEESSDELINKELAQRVTELYNKGREKDPEVFKEDIKLSPEKIRAVVGYFERVNLSATDLDSKGRAFETFMDSFFRGYFGQYFTPREIVKFVVDVLPITNESMVLDTSCGSGGFLLHALDKVRKQADQTFPKGKRTEMQNRHYYNYWHKFSEHNLYGIEINEQIARVAKMNMIIHDDGHTNVINYDGLAPIAKQEVPPYPNLKVDATKEQIEAYQEKIKKIKHIENLNSFAIENINQGFKENHFDFIITNPPFGSSVKQTEKAYLAEYDFGISKASWLDLKPYRKERANQSTEILFIEQAHKFLKAGGFLAIVIPDGILTNSSLQYVRDSIEEMYRIVAVVSMPQFAFSHTGAGVKSSVLFLQKYSNEQTKDIQECKEKLQMSIKQNQNYEKQMNEFERLKKQEIKELDSRFKDKQSKEYKEAKNAISLKYKEKVEKFQDTLKILYKNEKAKLFKDRGIDYEIFMAIAQNIGYDATGKPTGVNELDEIAPELRKFIQNLKK